MTSWELALQKKQAKTKPLRKALNKGFQRSILGSRLESDSRVIVKVPIMILQVHATIVFHYGFMLEGTSEITWVGFHRTYTCFAFYMQSPSDAGYIQEIRNFNLTYELEYVYSGSMQ